MTVGFHATDFNCHGDFEVAESDEPIEPGAQPAAILEFIGGTNMVMQLPISREDAEGMLGAFTQAEPMRQQLPPDVLNWTPENVGLPEGIFWVLHPQITGMAVTPPQQMPDGLTRPHWTLAFQEEDQSEVQVAVSDAMCVRIVRALAQVSNGEIGKGTGPDPDADGDG
jgi:hypothetical protein